MTDDPKNPKDDFEFPSLHGDSEPTPQEESAGPDDQKSIDELSKSLEDGPSKEAGPSARSLFFTKNKNAILIGIFVVVAILFWTIRTFRSDSNPIEPDQANTVNPAEIPVNVIEVRMGRFQDKIETVGNLKGEHEIELRFEMEGIIKEFNVTEGQRIKRGTMIASIIATDLLLKKKKAKLECEQMQKLYRLGGISKTKLDETCLNLEVAQAELRKTILKATKDGIIGDRDAEVGEYVSPQKKIATLVTIKNVIVKVGIIEKQVDKVYPGQKILVTVDAYPGEVFEGEIGSISPLVSGQSRTFEITALIPNENSILLPGMFARVKIITYEVDDAISVPNDALVKTAGGFQVYVVNKDNIAEERDIDVGYVSTEETQVEAGVAPGEMVVVQKPPELKAGSKVKIIEVQK